MARVTDLTDALGVDDVPAAPSSPEPRGARSAAAPQSPPSPPVPAEPPAVRKFTMLNGPDEDAQARELTDTVVRLAGLRVIKGMRADVVRALIEIAAADPKLQAKVAKLLKSRVALRVTARR